MVRRKSKNYIPTFSRLIVVARAPAPQGGGGKTLNNDGGPNCLMNALALKVPMVCYLWTKFREKLLA